MYEVCRDLLDRHGLTPERHQAADPAPGQPAHHHRRRGAAGLARGSGDHQHRPLRQHHRRHHSSGHARRPREREAEEGRSGAVRRGRRGLHRRREPVAVGVLNRARRPSSPRLGISLRLPFSIASLGAHFYCLYGTHPNPMGRIQWGGKAGIIMRSWKSVTSSGLALLLAGALYLPVWAQANPNVRPRKAPRPGRAGYPAGPPAGVVNYVEGQASMGGQALNENSAGSARFASRTNPGDSERKSGVAVDSGRDVADGR